MIPKINAHAIDVIVTFPKFKVSPPIPAIRITETTKTEGLCLPFFYGKNPNRIKEAALGEQ